MINNESYKSAGVDVHAGYKAVELMKSHVENTHKQNNIGSAGKVPESLGGFGGMFIPNLQGMQEPVLVSGTDGVGTKLDVAFYANKLDQIGIDLVAMCVNDIVCCGAKPLFFLDYISTPKCEPEIISTIVSGISEGCVQAGCALIGGETAEHPGTQAFDFAGFCTGIVDKSKVISKTAKAGDIIIGLESNGVHSNGFSLIRKVFNIKKERIDEINKVDGGSLFDELLKPTKIYIKPVLALIDNESAILSKCNNSQEHSPCLNRKIKGIAHITGGGFYENVPRCLPDGFTAEIKKNSYEIPEVFQKIMCAGNVPESDMYGTFNMGIGMVIVVELEYVETAISVLQSNGTKAYKIGKVIEGEELKII
ncbi:MAG: phosphoribosylformylglycinamidine cyclo-ligase [Oscillospiraceae bacterium]|nr:phosphoribosylformylglycinamidine cyclo-ligase [Oscillospiraceae bacterium]